MTSSVTYEKKKKKKKTAVIERLSWQLGMQFSGRYRCREVAVRGRSKLYHSLIPFSFFSQDSSYPSEA